MLRLKKDYHSYNCWIYYFISWWKPSTNWRTNRSIYSYCLWNHSTLWNERTCNCYYYGRSYSCDNGIGKIWFFNKFIPHPVVVGFTSGIALLIFSTQIKDFFGLNDGQSSYQSFLINGLSILLTLITINYYAFGIASLALLIILIFPKITHQIPGSIVALISHNS